MVRECSIKSFYDQLKSSASLSLSNPLLIFPSTSDADSLCALKIITHVLASDSIRYSCYPISSFREIEEVSNQLLQSSDQPISALFINWGCHRDLRRILNLGPLADLAYDFDVSALANAADLDSDDELEREGEGEDSAESESDEEDNRSRKRKKVSDKTDPMRLFQRLKVEYYKLGTFHGRPSGCLMFDIAHIFRKNTNELLWMACVSLADQFVHERLTNERYQASVNELEQHINSSGNLDAITSVTLKDGTKIKAPDASRISYEDEPRLMLLREWTLFDSMLCSSYVATKLKTWTDNGVKKLKLLLARMGFPLVDCQQKFQYMSMEVKQKMKDEFERFLPECGLTDFYYRSFLRLHGYSSKVSAADVVYGVTALLESFTKTKDSCAERFWVAYSALSLNNLEELRKGMQIAIQIQRAILRQGSSAVTKSGFIRSCRKFRWVKLGDALDAKLLGYPQALTKFCFFLIDALREKGAAMKPMICICRMADPEKALVVGVAGRPRLGALQANSFGIAFRAAAEDIGGEFSHELFESSWIVLDTVAVNSFMTKILEKL
ncbi:hypothetical protein AMTR_s00119p00070320 [Amborella trichopoda]|uniref:CDC45-like protein n=1 Tax=Amborella trichopoda TaxID=13333 RepID=W1NNC2_AMBTC|nr:hypothetical protein AMTR_s00119p00070320 [Amborella trichopoda]